MVKSLFAAFAVLMLLANVARADDERDRKARVALALASAERAPAPAPEPNPMPLPDYAEAYRLALKSGEPLVVYVGCDGRHPIEPIAKVVVAATRELGGYGRGSVVVGYPRDGKLFVHAVLRCPDHGTPVAKAAEEARRKIATPATLPAIFAQPPCACGPGCYCPTGACPQRCPVAVPVR
jgi:hypothetical protein